MTLSLISFALAIVCYAIKELQTHGKLKWSKGYYGFWDDLSHYRKYKKNWKAEIYEAPNNFYYRFSKIKYKWNVFHYPQHC
jgi:hypothetical protein